METTTYNGWTNQETWLIYTEFQLEVFRYNPDEIDMDSLTSMLYAHVKEVIEVECTNAYLLRSALTNLDTVNFYEIAEHIQLLRENNTLSLI